jgi:hypothetical protein
LATFGAGGFAAAAGFEGAAGFAAGCTAGAGVATLGGAVAAGGGGGAAAGAGADAAAGGEAAGFGGATGGGAAGFGRVALTTVLQAGDRLLTFFCRQASASLPRKPEHFDIASLRQFARNALCCSGVTCAVAVPQTISANASA